MEQKTTQFKCEPSREMRAVLHVVNADPELKMKALPFIDLERESINWPRIWSQDFCGGYGAALLWAQGIWCDKVETKGDPFNRAFAMDSHIQKAVIEALAIRWGLLK